MVIYLTSKHSTRDVTTHDRLLISLDAYTRRWSLFPGIPTLPVSVRQRKLSEGQLRRSLTHSLIGKLNKIFCGDLFFRIHLGFSASSPSRTAPEYVRSRRAKPSMMTDCQIDIFE